MGSNLRVTLAALAAAACAHAFNPIHESSYNLVPRANYSTATTLAVGAILDDRNTDEYSFPASIALQATPRMELGAGLTTRVVDGDLHVPYMVFGVKWLTLRHTSFQADLLIGTDLGTGKGFSLASYHRFTYSELFYSRLAVRAGFMEALVNDDALMAFEAAWYPGLMLFRPLSFELGLIGSSQTRNFENNLAMDIQPALLVQFARESMLQTAVAMGLAGDHKEHLRVSVTLIKGF